MLFHRKSCFLCRERSRGTGFIAFIKIIAAGDAPLGQRQGGVFRVPPPCLWTPPTPQRERGCSPLSDPKAVGLHTKNPSRFAKGFFVFRRLEAPQSLRDSSPKWEQAHPQALWSAQKLYRTAKASLMREVASPTGLDGRSPYPDYSFSRTTRDSSPKWEQAHPQALRSARKLFRHAKGSPFGRAGKPDRA